MRELQKTGLARAFRRKPTIAEAMLWELLRDRRLNGWKFRRQVPVDRYIVDFACLAPKLVIELDGPLHERPERASRDAERDAKLEANAFAIVRLDERVIRKQPGMAKAWITFVGNRILEGLQPFPDDEPLSSACGEGRHWAKFLQRGARPVLTLLPLPLAGEGRGEGA